VTALPGSVGDDLDKPAGDFLRRRDPVDTGFVDSPTSVANLVRLAVELGTIDAPGVRDDLVRLHCLHEIAGYTNLRQRALIGSGGGLPGAGNLAKLSMSRILDLTRDLAGRVLGPFATLHAYDKAAASSLAAATNGTTQAKVTEAMLFAAAPKIYGGTDEIQKNIIGERTLGLPREPDAYKGEPFREIPRNG
jgi:hypothetical protein